MKLFGIDFSDTNVYEVLDRATIYSKPEERKKGYFKSPQKGVEEVRGIVYQESMTGTKNPDNTPSGVFITGFTDACPFWDKVSLSPQDKKEKLAWIKRNIQKAYELKMSCSIAPTNIDFWKQYRYRLYPGLILNMANPEDRLTLYFALMNGKIVTDSNSKNPELHECPYKLVEHKIDYDIEDDTMLLEDEARSYMNEIITNDYPYFVSIMKYLGKCDIGMKTDKEMLRRSALRIFKGSDTSIEAERLITLLTDKAKTPDGRSEIEHIAKARDMVAAGIISKRDGKFLYKNQAMGTSLQDIAYKLRGFDTTLDKFTVEELMGALQAEMKKKGIDYTV